jgi:N,N'-diacetylchitobiose transport system substrate-binding protein
VKTRHVSVAALTAMLALAGCSSSSSSSGTPGAGASTTTTAASSAPADTSSASAPGVISDKTATLHITLMKDSVSDAIVQAATAEFKKAYPNVTTDVQILTWDGRDAKWTAALSAKPSTIDVLEMGNTDVLSWASKSALAEVDPSKIVNSGTWLESLKQAGTFDGKLYGVPYYAGGRVLWYNKDLVKGDAPKTLAELQTMAAKLKTSSVSGIYMPGRNWYVNTSFLVDAGMKEIATKGSDGKWTANLASDAAQTGLKTLVAFDKAVSNAPADVDETNDAKVFGQKQTAMLIEPGWWSGVVEDPKGEAFPAAKLGAWVLPGANGPMPQFLGGSNLAIAANSANPDLAAGWINALTGNIVMTQIAEAGTIPNTTTLIDKVPAGPAAMAAQGASAGGWFTPMSTKWSEVESKKIMMDFYQKVLAGGDPMTVAKDTDSKIEAILNS